MPSSKSSYKKHEVTNLEPLPDRHRLNRKRSLHTGSQDDCTFVGIFFSILIERKCFPVFSCRQTGITNCCKAIVPKLFPSTLPPPKRAARSTSGCRHTTQQCADHLFLHFWDLYSGGTANTTRCTLSPSSLDRKCLLISMESNPFPPATGS